MPINPLSSSQQESDDKQKKFNLIGGAPVNVTGFTPGQSASSGAPQTANQSGSFTNLQSYLDANKDQASGLGAKISDNIESTANEGRTDLSNANKEFSDATDAAGIDRNALNRDYIGNTVQSAYDKGSLGDTDANNFAQIRTKNDQFAAGTDAGPKSLSDLSTYQNAKSAFGQATDKANLTNTEGGRETLLKDTFARPNYSQGEASLDQLFVQNAPENRERFSTLRNNLLGQSGLASEDAQAIQAASDRRAQEAGELKSANQDEQDYLYNPNALSGTVAYDPTLENNEATATGAANQPAIPATRDQYGVYNYLQNNVQGRVDALKQQQADAEAAIRNQYQGTFANQNTLGVDMNALLNAGVQKASTFDPTVENTLSDSNLARLQALNSLAGRDALTVGDKVIAGRSSNQFDPSVRFNGADAQKLITDRSNAFQADMKNTFDQNESIPVAGYGFGQAPLPAAANDILTRMLDADPEPGADNDSADKVINAYQTEVNQLNATRKAYGMDPLDVNSFYDGGSQDAANIAAAKAYLASFKGSNVAPTSFQQTLLSPEDRLNGQLTQTDNPDYFFYHPGTMLDQAADTLVHNPQKGGLGIAPDVAQSIQKVATIKALQNIIALNRQQMANPTQKFSGSSINNSSTHRTFTD